CWFTLGLSTTLHFVPSQCSTEVWFTSLGPNTARWNPTAHTSVAEVADTRVNVFTNGPTFGLETLDHEVPSKCSIRLTCTPSVARVWSPPGGSGPLESWSPTAQMSPAETPEMLRSRPNRPGCGTRTAVHLVPSQCSTSGRDPSELTSEDSPTAHTSF